MNLNPECYPCMLKQAQKASVLVSDDPAVHHRILQAVAAELCNPSLPNPPPVIGAAIHEAIKSASGVNDPYAVVKKKFNKIASEMAETLRPRLEQSADPLYFAAKVAIAGNIIDFGNSGDFDLLKTVERVLEQPLWRDQYREFASAIKAASTIVYLTDNTGEIAFDRLLIEQINRNSDCQVTVAVKSGPIINDATLEDAREVGLDLVATIMETGLVLPGTIPERSSDEFRELFYSADVVVSKGQGNFETLDENRRSIFYLFQTKCNFVAELLGCPESSAILAFKDYDASLYDLP
jgi:damage-control phosphatase, subfamily I